jgi:hypothetical protein
MARLGTLFKRIYKEYRIVSPNDILFLIKDTGHFGSSNQNLVKPSGITLSTLRWSDVLKKEMN